MAPRTRANTTAHRRKPVPIARAVGKRIRQLRTERDWKFDAFVEETGLGRGYISELERGLVVPSLETLRRVADALGLTVADLVLGGSAREHLFEITRELTPAEIRGLINQVEPLAKAREAQTKQVVR